LKNEFKKGDVVVLIFHDHGSRYLGKMFNDDWMRERGFLEIKKPTARTIIESRKNHETISITANEKVENVLKLLTSSNISQVPVMRGHEVVGSVSESSLLMKLIDQPALKTEPVEKIMEKPFPVVTIDTPVDQISQKLTKEGSAVIAYDAIGTPHIITKHDVIKTMC